MEHAPHPQDTDEVSELCRRPFVLALKDAMNVVNGKWKLAVVSTLLHGPRGFTDIERQLDGITARMLSRELRELELNGVLVREASARSARFRRYALTSSGHRLKDVIFTMANWGRDHRNAHAAGAPADSAPPVGPP